MNMNEKNNKDYKLVGKFTCNDMDMVVVRMDKAVCVMERWEYDIIKTGIKREKMKNQQVNKIA